MMTTQIPAVDNEKLVIEIWTDIICPWCWIGLGRLKKGLEGFAHADKLQVIHRSVRLAPHVKPAPLSEVLSAKMGLSKADIAAMLKNVEATASAEGLSYNLANTLTGDTLDAHRLVKYATTQGKAHDMLERLYSAHLSEGVSIFNRQGLMLLASEIGLDDKAVEQVLNGDAFVADVEADQQALHALGKSGVPLFLINGTHVVSGAQSPDIFMQALQAAWDSRPSDAVNGATCSIDGCSS